jgi:hypothetical protein
MVTCSLCDRPKLARGWCNAHYKQWRKTGNPLGTVPRKRPSHCVNGHPFDETNTYVRADGKRTCKACARFFAKQWHRRERAKGRRFSQASKEWKAQYQRDIRAGLRTPQKRLKRSQNISACLTDFLTLDRGWWTVAALAHRLDAKPDTIRVALRRMTLKGLAETRIGEYQEWKALPS